MKKKVIGIIGLGFVGLPLLVLLNKLKFNTYGFDASNDKIKSLKNNISYNSDVTNQELKKVKKNSIFSMESISEIKKCDYIIICLPTPLNKNQPDMSFIKKAFDSIFKFLKKGQTLILESSVYPGATKDIFLKKLSKNFSVGKNFYLAYSPERIDPGQKNLTPYREITKLVSGYSKNCENKIVNLYKIIFKKIYLTKTIETAEFAKLFENTYRSVNIGLVNEIKILSNKMGIDMNEIITAASTKPFGFTPFNPGPGMGGHCIPIDPVFISWIGKKYNFRTKFIDLGSEINKYVTNWTYEKIIQHKPNLKKKSFLVIGAAYKKNINDCRESPSLKIIQKISLNKNFKVTYFDPYIPVITLKNKKIMKSIKKLSAKILKSYDNVIILTDHDMINYNFILKNSKIIFDTRGVYESITNKKIIKL
jgi:UDP-N-acetyl-D-glucosamine dehydrogenase